MLPAAPVRMVECPAQDPIGIAVHRTSACERPAAVRARNDGWDRLHYASSVMSDSRIRVSVPGRHLRPLLGEVSERIDAVVRSGRWLKGPETGAFQTTFASYCEVDYCLGVGNGTDGLELALSAAGARGGEVITVANAGGYTTTACRIVGATPVYVDVLEESLVLDPTTVEPMLGPQTRAVVVTHLFGNLADTAAIRGILAAAGRSDVLIIEDGSQAHGATLNGRKVGSNGDMSVFSFYPTKNLGALGDGGAVLCRNAHTAEHIEALHQYGWTSRYESSIPYGRNSRMDEIQAAVLNVKMPYLDEWNAERRSIVRRYSQAIRGSGLKMVTESHDGAVAHLAIVRTADAARLRNHLDTAGIDTDVHYPRLDFEQPSQSGLPDRRGALINSVAARGEIVTVPCFPGMTDGEVDRVAEALASFDGSTR